MIKMKGLGRGLDALLSGSDRPHGDEQRNLPVERLRPGKYQPRTQMDEGSLGELAASIRVQGVMQPILVRAVDGTPGAERYEIVAGERRWRAAQLAGLGEVPVLIRSIPDEQALAMALIENIQRENLNPLEEAQGLQRLIDEFGLTHQQAADAVGRSRPAATNLLRLLQLTAAVQDMLMSSKLDMGHARALLPLAGALPACAPRSNMCTQPAAPCGVCTFTHEPLRSPVRATLLSAAREPRLAEVCAGPSRRSVARSRM